MTNNRKLFEIEEREERVLNEKERSLIDMPRDLTQYIGSLIKNKKDLLTYAVLCKTVNNFFQPNLDKFKELVATALHYVAFGEIKELDELLKQYPNLIYQRGKTLDPCGRIVHGTVYRISLGAKDWCPFPEEPFEEMAEMIERHMRSLPGGEEEIELQKAEQFPEGWEEQEKERKERDSAALQKVCTAIYQSNTAEDCKHPIEEFINYLKSQNEVNIGYHYNDKLLFEARNLYYANFDNAVGEMNYKNKLMGIRVLGNIQGRMTACLAMAYYDAFMNIKDRRPIRRSLNVTFCSVEFDTQEKKYCKKPFFSPELGDSYYLRLHCLPLRLSNELHLQKTVLKPYMRVEGDLTQLIEGKQQVALNGKVPNSSQNLRNVYDR